MASFAKLTDTPGWGTRYFAGFASDGTNIYATGGHDPDGTPSAEIWKSANAGVTWAQVAVTGGQWSARSLHFAFFAFGKLHVYGGATGSFGVSPFVADLWASSNEGAAWTEGPEQTLTSEHSVPPSDPHWTANYASGQGANVGTVFFGATLNNFFGHEYNGTSWARLASDWTGDPVQPPWNDAPYDGTQNCISWKVGGNYYVYIWGYNNGEKPRVWKSPNGLTGWMMINDAPPFGAANSSDPTYDTSQFVYFAGIHQGAAVIVSVTKPTGEVVVRYTVDGETFSDPEIDATALDAYAADFADSLSSMQFFVHDGALFAAFPSWDETYENMLHDIWSATLPTLDAGGGLCAENHPAESLLWLMTITQTGRRLRVDLDTWDPISGQDPVPRWAGEIDGQIVANSKGRAGVVEFNVMGLIGRADKARLGMVLTKECLNTFGDSVCGVDKEALAEAATISAISGRSVTVTGLATTGEPNYWNRGQMVIGEDITPSGVWRYVSGAQDRTINGDTYTAAPAFSVDPGRMENAKPVAWKIAMATAQPFTDIVNGEPFGPMLIMSRSGTTFVLDRVIPQSYIGEAVTLIPGCTKTIANCRLWAARQAVNTVERFRGIGVAIPDRSPLA